MAAANVISVIGTAVSVLSLLLDSIPSDSSKVKVSYYIANDGGRMTLAMPEGICPTYGTGMKLASSSAAPTILDTAARGGRTAPPMLVQTKGQLIRFLPGMTMQFA